VVNELSTLACHCRDIVWFRRCT